MHTPDGIDVAEDGTTRRKECPVGLLGHFEAVRSAAGGVDVARQRYNDMLAEARSKVVEWVSELLKTEGWDSGCFGVDCDSEVILAGGGFVVVTRVINSGVSRSGSMEDNGVGGERESMISSNFYTVLKDLGYDVRGEASRSYFAVSFPLAMFESGIGGDSGGTLDESGYEAEEVAGKVGKVVDQAELDSLERRNVL